jgi:hypothetical protein
MSDTGRPSVGWPLYLDDVMTRDATARSAGFALPTGTVTFVMTDIEGSTRCLGAVSG